jgi:hypothetical protein
MKCKYKFCVFSILLFYMVKKMHLNRVVLFLKLCCDTQLQGPSFNVAVVGLTLDVST